MKTLEYIKSVLDEKTKGLEQVEAQPEMYDKATVEFAKGMKQEAEKWYQAALKRQTDEQV